MKSRILLGLLVVFHIFVAVTIARQPFRVNRATEGRSLIWPLHHDTIHRTGPGGDFFAVYHAGVKVERGESPYDNKEASRVTPDFFPFRYLPIVAQTLGRAATLLPPRAAYVGWIIVLELLLAGCLVVVWRSFPGHWRLGVSAALLLSSPYFLELHMGQFTFATAVLLAVGLWRLDDKLSSLGVVSYTASALLKVFPLASGAALLRTRRGFIAGAIAGLAVVAFSLPVFLVHPDWWKSFWSVNFGPTGNEGFHGGNYGLLYVLYQLVPAKGFASFATIWQLAILGTTAAFVLWRKPSILVGGLALALAHMLSYKHVWEHHASGAVVFAAFLLLRLHGQRAGWVVVGCLVLLALPTPFALVDALDPRVYDPTPSWSKFGRLILPMSKALPELVLWAVALWQSWRESIRAA